MKTIKSLKQGSKIFVDGYTAYFHGMTDEYTAFVAFDRQGAHTDYIEIRRCELRLTHQFLNEIEFIHKNMKKAIRFIKTFSKLNKELVKGIAFGILFMSLFTFAFKFMM